MISISPPSSGPMATGFKNAWVVNSEAPQNAATEPAVAKAMALPSRGALRLTGGASSKVSRASISARTAMPAAIQNSGRQAWNEAWAPPMSGPAATAAKMHIFMIIDVQSSLSAGEHRNKGRRRRDQQQAGAQALQDVADDEHGRLGRRRGEHRADHQQRRVDQHHPPLGEVR